jgi:acetyl-CoA carboxylase biotin carboxyl carrier protein
MDHDEIKALIELLKETDITDFQFEKEGIKLRLKREKHFSSLDIGGAIAQQAAPAPVAAAAAPVEAAAEEDSHSLVTVTAPLVGTFYRSSSPDSSVFVEVGDKVKKGQVICIVEAMKLMNEIECEVNGVIVKILVENTHPVEYGEPLFLVEPS